MEFTKKDLNKTIWIKQTDQEKNRRWYRVDATGKTLGRLAVDIAKKLMGKDRAYYSPRNMPVIPALREVEAGGS